MHLLYGIGPSPFGTALMGIYKQQIAFLGFIEDTEYTTQQLEDILRRDVDCSTLQRDNALILRYIGRIFKDAQKISYENLYINASDFSQKVFKALLNIPQGQTRSYKDIAQALGKPKAYRAVGRTVANNPIAYVIPCHRVIQANKQLGGFKWGTALKHQILEYEGVIL